MEFSPNSHAVGKGGSNLIANVSNHSNKIQDETWHTAVNENTESKTEHLHFCTPIPLKGHMLRF